MKTVLTPEQIDLICSIYATSAKPVREIARQFKISDDNVYRILDGRKIPRRGKAFAVLASRTRQGKSNSFAHVFLGRAKDYHIAEPKELELAKATLRRRGYIVFNAVVDGSGGPGIVKCDGRLFTAAQIIERAAQ